MRAVCSAMGSGEPRGCAVLAIRPPFRGGQVIRRLALDQILAAYEATGTVPEPNVWLEHRTELRGEDMAEVPFGPPCACPISALCLARGVRLRTVGGDNYGTAATVLNLSVQYVRGFTEGFDGDPHYEGPLAWATGYEDGKEARRVLLGEGGKA